MRTALLKLLVLTFLEFEEVVTDSKQPAEVLVTETKGEIVFSKLKSCVNKNNLSDYEIKWKFPVENGEALYIKFLELRYVSCINSTLAIEGRNKKYIPVCMTTMQLPSYYRFRDTTLMLKYDPGNCLMKFAFKFYRLKHFVKVLSKTPVTLGKKVRFLIAYNRTSSFEVDTMCYMNFEKNITKVFGSNNRLSHIFSEPGKQTYKSVCSSPTWSGILQSRGVIQVESYLSKENLDLVFIKGKSLFRGSVFVRFRHKCAFPVHYRLKISYKLYVQNPKQPIDKKCTKIDTEHVVFYLDDSLQTSLGPGLHSFVLTLFNNVSSVNFVSNISLDLPLHGFSIYTEQFVAVFPNRFTVTVTFTQVSTVFITLKVKRHPGVFFVGNQTEYCWKNCRKIQMKMFIRKPGRYKILGFAYNSVSGDNVIWGPFDALPQVYETYIMAPRPVIVNTKAAILIFIRSDVGFFHMSAKTNEQHHQVNFEVLNTTFPNNKVTSVPFDSTKYFIQKDFFYFKTTGNNHIKLNIKNSKQDFQFDKEIFVSEKFSCLKRVKIRDRKYGSWINTPLKVGKNIQLAADAELVCDSRLRVEFKWQLFKLNSTTEVFQSRNEVYLDSKVDQREIFIQPHLLPKGLIAVRSICVTRVLTTNRIKNLAKDFMLLEAPQLTLDVSILGGTRREIGKSVPFVYFEVFVNNDKYKLKYEWFCSVTSNVSEASDMDNTTSKERNSAKMKWFSNEKKTKLSTIALKLNHTYLIRVFVSGLRFKRNLADQEIRMISHRAPKMKLQCLKNCHKLLLPQIPLVLYLKCETCKEIVWTLLIKQNKTLNQCKNKRICEIEVELKDILDTNETAVLIVKGINHLRYSAVVEVDLMIKSRPKGGKCSVSPLSGVGYLTMFNVACNNFTDSFLPLTYTFQLIDEGKQHPLLQNGFSNVLANISFPSNVNSQASVGVDICNVIGSCIRRLVVTKIISRVRYPRSYDATKRIETIVNSNNFKKLAQILASFSDDTIISEAERTHVLKTVDQVVIVSLQTAKEVADVLNLITRDVYSVSHESKDLTWKILKKIQEFVSRLDFAESSKYTSSHMTSYSPFSIVKSCLATATNLMLSPHFTLSKIREALRVIELGRMSLWSVIPVKFSATFWSPNLRAILIRKENSPNGTILKWNDKVRIHFLPSLRSQVTDDVINIEIYNFNASSINFNTDSRKVNDVTFILTTSGWERSIILPYENVEFSIGKLTKFENITKSNAYLQVERICDKKICKSVGRGTTTLFVKPNSKNSFSGAYIVIKIKPIDGSNEFVNLNISIGDKKLESKLVKTFHENDETYIWLIPTVAMSLSPNTIYSMQMIADVKMTLDDRIYLKVHSYLINCFYWDDMINNWNDDGCEPISSKDPDAMMCRCKRFDTLSTERRRKRRQARLNIFNPKGINLSNKREHFLSLFGSYHMQLSEDNLDISPRSGLSLDKNLRENPIVIIVISILGGLYVCLAIVSYKKDQNILTKKEFIEVIDNSPFEDYRYYVTVYTGNRRTAGTTSTVSLRLAGEHGKSSVHLIQTPKQNYLKSESVNSFLITTPGCLGKITAVRLWIDHHGKSPEWFLQRMTVQDLETKHCWIFNCNVWFDQKTDYMFTPKKFKDLNQFGIMFAIKLENYLKNRHAYISYFKMRPWKFREMSRLKRITCCYFQITLTLIIVFIFYKVQLEYFPEKLEPEFYSFRWSHITTGMIGGFLAFMATFALDTFFRRSKDQKVEKYLNSNHSHIVPTQNKKYERKKLHREKHQHDETNQQEVLSPNDIELVEVKTDDQNANFDEENTVKEKEILSEKSNLDKLKDKTKNILNVKNLNPKHLPLFKQKNKEEANSSQSTKSEKGFLSGFIVHYKNPSLNSKPTKEHRAESNKSSQQEEGYFKTFFKKLRNGVPQTSARAHHQHYSEPDDLLENHKVFAKNSNESLQTTSNDSSLKQADSISNSNDALQIEDSLRSKTRIRVYFPNIPNTSGRESSVSYHNYSSIENFPNYGTCLSYITSNEKVFRRTKVTSKGIPFPSARTSPHKQQNSKPEHKSKKLKNKQRMDKLQKKYRKQKIKQKKAKLKNTFDFDVPYSTSKMLPPIFTNIAWIVATLAIIASNVFSILFGMNLGSKNSLKWLVSSIAGCLQNILVLETIKATLLAFVSTLRQKKLDLSDWIPLLPNSIERCQYLNPNSVQQLLDKERAFNPAYHPRSSTEIHEEEGAKKIERRAKRNLKGLLLHIMNLTLLLIASLGQRDNRSIYFHETLYNMIVSDAMEISSSADVYTWAENTLANAFSEERKVYFPDGQVIVLPKPKLRQKRVIKDQTCQHRTAAKKMKLTDKSECILSYHSSVQDKQSYGTGWRSQVTTDEFENYGRPWKYSTGNVTWISNFYGEYSSYDGEGYFITIPSKKNETTALMHYLKQNRWIDIYTRLILLEVTLYNVPRRLFCVMRLGIELPITGKPYVSSIMSFMKTHYIDTNWDIVVYVALYGILAMSLYNVSEISGHFREKGFAYIKNIWHILYILTSIVSVVAVVMYLTRASYTDLAIFAFKKNVPSFPYFHASAYIENLTRSLLSTCVFLTMLYTVKILEGDPLFELMHATMDRGGVELAGHSLYLIFLYAAFCHLGLLWFAESQDFNNLIRSMQTVFGYSMEAFTSTDLLSIYPGLGGLYLALFVIVFTKCFVNFYAVILENSYRESKLMLRDFLDQAHVFAFGRKQLRSMFTIKDQKLQQMKTKKEKKDYINYLIKNVKKK